MKNPECYFQEVSNYIKSFSLDRFLLRIVTRGRVYRLWLRRDAAVPQKERADISDGSKLDFLQREYFLPLLDASSHLYIRGSVRRSVGRPVAQKPGKIKFSTT